MVKDIKQFIEQHAYVDENEYFQDVITACNLIQLIASSRQRMIELYPGMHEKFNKEIAPKVPGYLSDEIFLKREKASKRLYKKCLESYELYQSYCKEEKKKQAEKILNHLAADRELSRLLLNLKDNAESSDALLDKLTDEALLESKVPEEADFFITETLGMAERVSKTHKNLVFCREKIDRVIKAGKLCAEYRPYENHGFSGLQNKTLKDMEAEYLRSMQGIMEAATILSEINHNICRLEDALTKKIIERNALVTLVHETMEVCKERDKKMGGNAVSLLLKNKLEFQFGGTLEEYPKKYPKKYLEPTVIFRELVFLTNDVGREAARSDQVMMTAPVILASVLASKLKTFAEKYPMFSPLMQKMDQKNEKPLSSIERVKKTVRNRWSPREDKNQELLQKDDIEVPVSRLYEELKKELKDQYAERDLLHEILEKKAGRFYETLEEDRKKLENSSRLFAKQQLIKEIHAVVTAEYDSTHQDFWERQVMWYLPLPTAMKQFLFFNPAPTGILAIRRLLEKNIAKLDENDCDALLQEFKRIGENRLRHSSWTRRAISDHFYHLLRDHLPASPKDCPTDELYKALGDVKQFERGHDAQEYHMVVRHLSNP